MIRPAVPADVAAMREIERAAGEPFRAIGLDVVADDEPLPGAVLVAYAAAGRAFVDVRDGAPAGYLITEVVDGCAHLEQVSVLPRMRGRRIGEGLVEHLAGWARDRRLPALTLTTYRDVPWNGPYWVRLGFRELVELTPGLRAIRAEETARGLDVWPRLAMRRDLG
ncbi:GCN5-related N-acetyltransferase [Pseudonocardia sp. Ae168_Ps1]|jgi:GNAT superfamily N-acetyltransferase|uniref:GNAT family N-acetyltransferase n=1 Tax=unclassified Pseudonocardia TaxID=2619320 RepID=UPI0001FFE0E7|nr:MULTISPECIES: GNAT family N-acetyltransferase [unclassified Pseudonocardia]ALE75401.1 GCN5 family acetyltransferase [Pseudonocardia sp. EC080625-04]ALL74767.1 GCN5 family acetyltransferase [Pseudonocardia sp. EC080610-09]ALL81790.1 GCN5 family acetyltransferase [Pseudonocardia sp. EC080619-01]OLL76439.1 GCN5-related N-acetyltransferase [Pseudonocardia sp. Ae150A_Ps1]OLL82449.1 GCN5-related N-acetyltransferase [Pseudonocardia sp. Ae168_Ps1]